MTKKVIILGLDGFGPSLMNILEQWSATPSIAELKQKGYFAITACIPPSTLPGWTSIASGVNPGKHGVFEFLRYDHRNPSETKLYTADDVMYPRFHEMLSFVGKRCVVINLPLSWPLKRMKGVLLADWLSPKNFVYPTEYASMAKDYIYSPRVAPGVEGVDFLVESVLSNIEVAKRFFNNVDWDLFFVMFSETDKVMHLLGLERLEDLQKHRKALKIFEIIDSFVSWIMRNSPENSLIVVVSDHGINDSDLLVRMNTFLSLNGFTRRTVGTPHDFTELVRCVDGEKVGAPKPLDNKLIRLLIGMTSRSTDIQRLAKSLHTRLHDRFITKSMVVDYRNSEAYMPYDHTYGIVAKEQDTVRYRVLAALKNLEKHIDRKLFHIVDFKEKVYQGFHTSPAPDIIVIPKADVSVSKSAFGSAPISRVSMIDHNYEGILIFYGPAVKQGIAEGYKCPYDVIPTVFSYLGLAIPHHTDGTILHEAFYHEEEVKITNYLAKYEIMKKLQRLKHTPKGWKARP